MKTLLLIILALANCLYLVWGQVCGNPGVEAGLPSFGGSRISSIDVSRVMVEKGGINCMGVVREWRFYQDWASCVMVKFQIWRLVGPDANNDDIYKLVGENIFDPSVETAQCSNYVGGDIYLRVPLREQIPVQPGDLIGWKQITAGSMLHYNIPAGAGRVLHHSSCNINVGATCTFRAWLNLDFSLRAYIETGPEPVFGNLPNSVTALEGASLNTTIFTATATHPADIQSVSNIMDGAVILSFSISAPTVAFSISSASSSPTRPASAIIQTEILFDYQVQQQYLVNVVVEGLGVSATRVLTVNIVDQNQPHVIDNLDVSIVISARNTPENEQIYQVRVSDPSTASPLPIYYYIDSTTCTNGGGPPTVTVASPFRIQSDTGFVYVNKDMADWLEADECVLDIGTTDYVNVVTGQLTVKIIDISQPVQLINLPVITVVPENLSGGSNVYRVLTDSTEPNALKFEFIAVTPVTYSFEIHPTLGLITTSADPDFDVTVADSYDLTMKVTDRLGRTDSGILTVNIDWVNRAPYYQPHVYTHRMPEESNGNTGLLVYVYDRDAEHNLPPSAQDALTCSILPGFGSDRFQFGTCNAGTGNMLEQIARIDVDGNPEYSSINLTVRVEDRSGLSGTADIYIEVYNINDNAPIFSPNSYTADIDENTPGGVSVLTVTATDLDSGRNGEFTYSVSDINGGAHPRGSIYFQVDPISGVVSTKHPADYENFTEVDFEVLATDKGSPQIPTPCDVSITINDVNDNRPFYNISDNSSCDPYELEPDWFYSDELRDNTFVGHNPLNLSADDTDTVTPDVTFYLLQPVDHFALEANGSIVVAKSLNTYSKYVLFCMAEDNGDPNLLASPPFVARFDSFDRKKHLIDITLGIAITDDIVLCQFIRDLREELSPWFFKKDGHLLQNDRTIVTIYALEDNSTIFYANLGRTKHFVMRDPLLSKLRQNMFGKPNDVLKGDRFIPYDPILVMPTYPNWWLDTLVGLIVLSALCLLGFILPLGIMTYACKRNKWFCFQDKTPPTNHDWPEPDNDSLEMDDSSTIRTRSRQGSVDTVHTMIYDPNLIRPV